MAEVGGLEHGDGVGQRDGTVGDGVVEQVGHGGGVDLGGKGGEAGEVDLGVAVFGGFGVGQVADLEAKGANGTDGVAGQRDVDVEAGVVNEDFSRARAAPMASLSWRATPRLCSMVPKAVNRLTRWRSAAGSRGSIAGRG